MAIVHTIKNSFLTDT